MWPSQLVLGNIFEALEQSLIKLLGQVRLQLTHLPDFCVLLTSAEGPPPIGRVAESIQFLEAVDLEAGSLGKLLELFFNDSQTGLLFRLELIHKRLEPDF